MALSDLKELIKETPISQLIGAYIPLKTRGNLSEGLCPFHPDTNPSLKVNDSKKLFHCFACQTGGDAITFVQKFRGLGFVESLKDLAQMMGLDFSSFEDKSTETPKLIMARKILNCALRMYRMSSSSVFENFIKNRHLSQETVETFQLGQAPKNNSLFNYLNSLRNPKERTYALKVAKEIGMIKEGTSPHDKFRDRVMFPIFDRLGKIIGFTSRALNQYQKAKYMNSESSCLFDKKNVLYGLHLAKYEIQQKQQVILVEGNMDMIALYQQGFKNTVAIQGTAIGDGPLKILLNLAKDFYLGLDSDPSGEKAALKINQNLLSKGIIPKFLVFSPHKDPDEFLQKEGHQKFQELMAKAPAFIDVLIEKEISKSVSDSGQELAHLKNCFEILAPLGEGLDSSERIVSIGQKLNLKSPKDQILKAFNDFLKIKSLPSLKTRPKKSYPQATPKKEDQLLGKGEKNLLFSLIQNPNLLTHRKTLEILDFLGNNEVTKLVLKLKKVYFEIDEVEYLNMVLNLMNSGEIALAFREIIGSALYGMGPLNKNVDDLVFDHMREKIQWDRLVKEEIILKQEIENCPEGQELSSLMTKLMEIQKAKNHLGA